MNQRLLIQLGFLKDCFFLTFSHNGCNRIPYDDFNFCLARYAEMLSQPAPSQKSGNIQSRLQGILLKSWISKQNVEDQGRWGAHPDDAQAGRIVLGALGVGHKKTAFFGPAALRVSTSARARGISYWCNHN